MAGALGRNQENHLWFECRELAVVLQNFRSMVIEVAEKKLAFRSSHRQQVLDQLVGRIGSGPANDRQSHPLRGGRFHSASQGLASQLGKEQEILECLGLSRSLSKFRPETGILAQQ